MQKTGFGEGQGSTVTVITLFIKSELSTKVLRELEERLLVIAGINGILSIRVFQEEIKKFSHIS